MKYKIIIIVCMATLLASCVRDTENLFDKSAEGRINEAVQTYRDLLTAQTNGWIVEYYPEKTQKYGGFNLYFRFEGNQVAVRSEIDPSVSAISTWSTGTDMGPTINFDTYNSVLHYFSDPGVPQGGGYGLNYEGDYEFVVVSGSADEFILMGKKTKNIIRMTPLPANKTADAYFQSIDNMSRNVIAPAYKMTVNNREVTIEKTFDANAFTLTVDGETVFAPFMVTPAGIKFYQPVTILNQTLQVFTYNAAEDKIKSNQNNAEISFALTSLANYFVDHLANMNWYFSTENMAPGSPFATAWNTAKTRLKNELGYDLAYMWFGTFYEGLPEGLSFICFDPVTNVAYAVLYLYDFVPVGDNSIKLVYNGDLYYWGDGGLNAHYSLQDFTVTAFAGKTFTLEPDVDITNPKNMVRMKELKLIDSANPNNWVKVGLEEVLWP